MTEIDRLRQIENRLIYLDDRLDRLDRKIDEYFKYEDKEDKHNSRITVRAVVFMCPFFFAAFSLAIAVVVWALKSFAVF